MPETHQAKLYGTNEKFTVVDDEPMRSAKLFKAISDEIWSRRPRRGDFTDFGVASVLEPFQALEELNNALEQIDIGFVPSFTGEDFTLERSRGQKITVPSYILRQPETASIGTSYFDSLEGDRRTVFIDERRETAKFTDGHRDYARELSANFRFRSEDDITFSLHYLMQRRQYNQAYSTDLYLLAFCSAISEQGSDGKILHHQELAEDQELRVLKVFTTIGGIAVEPELLEAE